MREKNEEKRRKSKGTERKGEEGEREKPNRIDVHRNRCIMNSAMYSTTISNDKLCDVL